MVVLVGVSGPRQARAWGGGHHLITRAAIEMLPVDERERLGTEAAALEKTYCTFPDLNWPCYGQWGGGVGDPRLPRFPDTRRKWDVSYYCGWDPVLRVGKSYPHAPPSSYEAARVLFARAANELHQQRDVDAWRIAGAMFHYIQDSGSFPHVQPIHRKFDVKSPKGLGTPGYRPRQLGDSAESAASALATALRELVAGCEARMAPFWEGTGLSFSEVKGMAAKQTMPPRVSEVWNGVLQKRPDEVQSVAIACAADCGRLCADALHTLLMLAPGDGRRLVVAPAGNLVFNASFEVDDGDGVPDGWYVEYGDLKDELGRADRYALGTHWERFVHGGLFSVLIRNAPKDGLRWQPTWRRAFAVTAGEKYLGSAWVKLRAATGRSMVALEFCDANYKRQEERSASIPGGDAEWQQVTVDATAPQGARWLRLILESRDNRGAVWFDDVELRRAGKQGR